MLSWFFISGVCAGLAGYTALSTLAAQQLTRTRRRHPAMGPDAVGLVYENIWFSARGEALTIAAWHLPAPGATRAVIIAHGIGGCRGKEFTVRSHALVAQLVQCGFTVVMLDLRGHGASDMARMTYGINERRDVLGAVDWLLARGYAPGAIGVLGASMGGVAGIGAASEEPAIGALIIDSACADFPAMMRRHFRRQSKLPTFFLPGALLAAHLITGARLAQLRPAADIRALSQLPVLIIHARGDTVVPISHGQALAQAGNAELWITEGNRHLGSFGANQLDYCQRVTQFFESALAGAAAAAMPIELPSRTMVRLREFVRSVEEEWNPS